MSSEFNFPKDRLLYEDERIKIYQAETPNEHDVVVGNAYCYLGRAILRELAEVKDVRRIRSALLNLNQHFLSDIEKQGVSLESLAWAFAKTRIKELKN